MRFDKKVSRRRVSATATQVLACVAVGSWLAACSSASSDDPEWVATIDGAPVTMAEVEDVLGDDLAQMDQEYRRQRHQLVEAGLDRAIRDRLLEEEAAARGLSVDEVIAAETRGLAVSDADVAAFYEQNRAALGGGSLEEWSPRIRQFMEENRQQSALNDLGARLAQGKDVVVLLDPYRVELNNEGSPIFGPANAPVTLTEFSDFECPYCGQFFPTLKRLAETYGDDLKVVYRQYPLDTHAHAWKAAEASLCAHDQDRFWEMHDLMFEEQGTLGVESLIEKAERLGLDVGQFRACLDSGRHAEQIRRDMREANRIGVDGTPAVFVNGIPAPGGAAPYEVLAELIDDELGRGG
jgi:protein-disulfide isomerase